MTDETALKPCPLCDAKAAEHPGTKKFTACSNQDCALYLVAAIPVSEWENRPGERLLKLAERERIVAIIDNYYIGGADTEEIIELISEIRGLE